MNKETSFGKRLYWWSLRHGIFNIIPDKLYLKWRFRSVMGYPLDLKNPRTYNEKLQWLKLYDRNPDYIRMVDKYEAKKYISEKIGEGYVIPLIGVWDSVEEIDFAALPNSFVLKCTHDSGGLVICKDKSKLDIEKAKAKIRKSMNNDYFQQSREWPYKNVKHRIIAEQYMIEGGDGPTQALTDYKFFCFDGEPKVVYISKDKAEDPRTDFFDMDYNHLPIRMRDPNADVLPEKPEKFEEMKEIARILSAGIRHVRVDFYQIEGRIYVGELTFFHCGGLAEVKPKEWNLKMGDWIKIDK